MALNRRAEYREIPVRARDDWYVGLDIGQSIDPSAVCALQHVVTPGKWSCNDTKEIWTQDKTERFFVRHLSRLPLGMPYPEQVGHVIALLARDPLKGATFGLDYTGCGRPVADLYVRAGLKPHCVLITAGNDVSSVGHTHHVPKLHLISTVEARLHSRELRFAPELEDAPVLREELKDFARKVSDAGRVTYNARSGKHDDLILSISIAMFMACRDRPESSVTEFL